MGDLKRTVKHIFTLFLFITHGHGESINDVHRVLDDVFSQKVYNKMVRGVKDQTQTIIVNSTVSLLSIVEFNEVEEALSLMGVIYMTWIDERLVWDPDDYNNTEVVHAFQNTVWKPEVVLSNPAKAVSLLGDDRVMTTHYFNGSVRWSVGDLFKLHCSLDVTAFPWDQQICCIELMVWGYRSHEVKLVASDDGVFTNHFQGNGAWELVEAGPVPTDTMTTPPKVAFSLVLKRYSIYYVVNIFVPIITLIVLNLLAFLIPTSSGEKLSYCITLLLALAVFLSIVSDNLPRTSKNMASLCFFLMFILFMSTIICACSVLSTYLFHMAESRVPPLWLCKLVSVLSNRKGKRKEEDDVISMKDFRNEKTAELNPFISDKSSGILNKTDSTWQDISTFIDKISFIITFVWLLISCILFTVYVSD